MPGSNQSPQQPRPEWFVIPDFMRGIGGEAAMPGIGGSAGSATTTSDELRDALLRIRDGSSMQEQTPQADAPESSHRTNNRGRRRNGREVELELEDARHKRRMRRVANLMGKIIMRYGGHVEIPLSELEPGSSERCAVIIDTESVDGMMVIQAVEQRNIVEECEYYVSGIPRYPGEDDDEEADERDIRGRDERAGRHEDEAAQGVAPSQVAPSQVINYGPLSSSTPHTVAIYTYAAASDGWPTLSIGGESEGPGPDRSR